MREVVASLAEWKDLTAQEKGSSGPVPKIVLILEHEYPEANFRMNRLKGKDQLTAGHLSIGCEDSGLCMYLAHLQYTESGGVEVDEEDPDEPYDVHHHEIIDVDEEQWVLRTVFDRNGQWLATDVPSEERHVVNNDILDNLEGCEEEFVGWTGNEGCTATHFYYRSCLVVVARQERFNFLASADAVNFHLWVSTLSREMEMQDLQEMEELCRDATALKPNAPKATATEYHLDFKHSENGEGTESRKAFESIPNQQLGAIVKAALRLNSPKILFDVSQKCSDMLSIGAFEELGRALGYRDMNVWWSG